MSRFNVEALQYDFFTHWRGCSAVFGKLFRLDGCFELWLVVLYFGFFR